MNRTLQVFEPKLNKTLNITYFDTADEACFVAIKRLLSVSYVGWDTETTYAIGWEEDKQAGLDPYRSRLRISQFALDDGTVFVFDHLKLPDTVNEQIKALLESELPVKVGHNEKFDVKMSRYHLGVRHMGRLFDTDLGYRLTKCGQYFAGRISLSDLCKELLGFKLEKETRRSDWSIDVLSDEQIKYGALDAYVVLPLRKKIIEDINELDLRYPAKIDFSVIDPTAAIELTGMPIDAEKWISVDTIMKAKRLDMMDQIADEFRNAGVVKQQGLFAGAPLQSHKAKRGEKRNVPTNSLTSPQRMASYLEAYGIRLPKKKDRKTQKQSKTTGTPSLKPLRNHYKIIPLLIEFRELDKRKTSYGAKFIEKYCNPITKRIHSDYDPNGAKTGRYTSNKPNNQNIPALKEYRSCFIAPPGWKFVGFDYSQIELRIAAELSQDPGYIEAFLSGEDFHTQTAIKMFGVSPDDPNFPYIRAYAKRINFGIIYGMGAGKLAMQTDLYESKDVLRLILLERQGLINNAEDWLEHKMTVDELKRWQALKLARQLTTDEIEEEVAHTDTAQDYLDKYHQTFETLMRWLKARGRETAENEGIRMESGRLIKFWVNHKDKVSVAQAERNGMNTPIQGLAGEVLKLATRSCFDVVYKANLDHVIRPALTMHDELQWLVKDEYNKTLGKTYAEWAQEVFHERAKLAGEVFLKTVPVRVDVKVSDCWEK